MARTNKAGLARLNAARGDFCTRLAAMKAEAGRLGLFKTLHAMDKATTAVGWEVAELRQEEPRPVDHDLARRL